MDYKKYFEERDANNPKPKWVYGDRVFGKYKSVPLIGMVIRQTEDGVLVHADLPLKVNKEILNIVSVPMKELKRLVVL
jgi:hypothetical protein